MIALVRTSEAEDRHGGLSQVLVDLHAPGVEVHPIPFLDGTADFNEVVFTDVFVPDDRPRGHRGHGLGADRPGARVRARRTRPLAVDLPGARAVPARARRHRRSTTRSWSCVGSAIARFWGLRNLSLSVARAIDAHGQPSVQAALVKEMGTRFEQDLLESIRRFVDVEPVPDSPSLFERLLANAILTVAGVHHPRRHDRDPAFGRGEGTAVVSPAPDPLLSETATRVFADTCDVRGGGTGRGRRLGAGHVGCGGRDRPGLGVGTRGGGRIRRHARRRDRDPADRRRSRGAAPAGRDRGARRLAARGRGPGDPRRRGDRGAAHATRRPRTARRCTPRDRAPRPLGADRRPDRGPARRRRRSGGGAGRSGRRAASSRR